jgi:hypothetical protein
MAHITFVRGRGRPPIHEMYELKIAELVERGLTNKEISSIIEREARRAGRTDFPTFPTVKVHAARQRARSREERWIDQPFQWPDSILRVSGEPESSDGTAEHVPVSDARRLPPQASEAALELLSLCRPRWWAEKETRPTNRQVRWYWYVLSAAPDINRDLALQTAFYLSSVEFADDRRRRTIDEQRDMAAIEFLLASCPWRSAEHAERYLKRADSDDLLAILSVLSERSGDWSRSDMEDRIASWGIDQRFIDSIIRAWGGEFLVHDEETDDGDGG